MAGLTQQQREQNHARQVRQAQRREARGLARTRAYAAVKPLFSSEPPDWYSAEQQAAYAAELGRIAERIGAVDLAR
jgi:hypothetical protein